jgi:hypothetical protein
MIFEIVNYWSAFLSVYLTFFNNCFQKINKLLSDFRTGGNKFWEALLLCFPKPQSSQPHPYLFPSHRLLYRFLYCYFCRFKLKIAYRISSRLSR